MNRVVDIAPWIERKIDLNLENRAQGPAGKTGQRLRARLEAQGQRVPLLGPDDSAANRNYIREFVLARSRTLGQKYGVQYAEAFHYIGSRTSRRTALEDYIDDNAVPLK